MLQKCYFFFWCAAHIFLPIFGGYLHVFSKFEWRVFVYQNISDLYENGVQKASAFRDFLYFLMSVVSCFNFIYFV